MTAKTINESAPDSNQQSSRAISSTSIRRLTIGLLILAAILLLASIQFPYWRMVLDAPQYPQGLEMRVFVNRMTGDEDETLDDVREIDGLNHYIGMESLYNAAQLERQIALPAVIIMSVLLVVAAVWKHRWSWLLTIPAIGFPFVFLGDLAFWLNNYGQNLDPLAPLSSAIKPFTPPILGEGVIGNFRTIAYIELGWFIAVAGGVLIIIALLVRLVDARRQAHAAG